MTTSKHTHHTSVSRAVLSVGVLTLLTACGGGGNGAASSSAGESNTRTVTGYMVSATVRHSAGAEDQITFIPSIGHGQQENIIDNVASLSQYRLNNGAHSIDIDTSTNVAEGLATVDGDDPDGYKQNVKMGGITWDYSRFGLLQDKKTNSNGFNTEYYIQTPYALAEPLVSPTAVPAMYTSSAKATGIVTVSGKTWRNFECDVTVGLSVDDDAQIAAIELLNCVDAADNTIAYTTNGSLQITKTLSTEDFSAKTDLFSATFGTYTMNPSEGHAKFILGGPNADEIVGTFYIEGQSGDRLIFINLAFGAKK